MSLLFYDFEVFIKDWLVVIIDPATREKTVIHNDRALFTDYFEKHKKDLWVGFNSTHYDQYILKGILLGMNPKNINDFIVAQGNDGYLYSNAFREITFNNYDVFTAIDRGLKYFEGSMGLSIEETSVPFDINRPLNEAEIAETIKYCTHDVESTIAVFLRRKEDFDACKGLVQLYKLPLETMTRTKVQISATILGARKQRFNDEFSIDFPPTMDIKKYSHVVDWFKQCIDDVNAGRLTKSQFYKKKLNTMIAGVPHVFAWGGVHGARKNYIDTGYYVNMDVASLYPSLMLEYDLISRACDPQAFKDIVALRLKYKKEKNPIQKSLKVVINGTYGASKANSPLNDARQANRVCVYGQLLLLDLIEHLEPYCEIIQSNTDGVLIKVKDMDKSYDIIDDIAYEWEQRTRLNLEFDNYIKVVQKDVNNYLIIDEEGHYKTKGLYVQDLNDLNYDLAVVNRAVVDFFTKGKPIETTINECDTLKDFQFVKKIGGMYDYITHAGVKIPYQCVRVFASKDYNDGALYKHKAVTDSLSKIDGTSHHSRIIQGDINGVKVPSWLDRDYYLRKAEKRKNEFISKNNCDNLQLPLY